MIDLITNATIPSQSISEASTATTEYLLSAVAVLVSFCNCIYTFRIVRSRRSSFQVTSLRSFDWFSVGLISLSIIGVFHVISDFIIVAIVHDGTSYHNEYFKLRFPSVDLGWSRKINAWSLTHGVLLSVFEQGFLILFQLRTRIVRLIG
ncbi:hypothetical protein HK096_008894, partial [Nowakowskiella sp. JEL0078]